MHSKKIWISDIIPPGCDEWTLTSDVDIDNDSIDHLSKNFNIRVGRDYHGCGCYESQSLFTFITDTDKIKKLLKRFEDKLLSYHDNDDSFRGNILHNVIINPNKDCYYILKNMLTVDELCMLANEENKRGKKPIECTYHLELFKDLLKYTSLTPDKLVKCMSNKSIIAKYIFNTLVDLGLINNI